MKSIKVLSSIILMVLLVCVLTACGGNSQNGSLPATPGAVSVTPLNGQVDIAWTTMPNAASYNIYWSTTAGLTTTTGTKITDVNTPYIQTGLTNGTTYYYLVTAVSSAGESAPTAQVSSTPELSVPPTGVTATAGNNQAIIDWEAVSGATSYNIYWSYLAGVSPTSGTRITVPAQSSNYTQKGLSSGTNYYYVVTAVNANGESLPSSQVNAEPSTASSPYIIAKVFSTADGSIPLWGWLTQVGVYTDSTQQTPIANATAVVNGTTLSYNGSDQHYEGNVAVAAAGTINVQVIVNSITYSISEAQYNVPGVSAPVSGTVWQHTSDNTVTWTPGYPVNGNMTTWTPGALIGTSYFIGLTDNKGNFIYPTNSGSGGPLEIPVTGGSWTIPANTLNPGNYNALLAIGTSGLADNAPAVLPIPGAAPGSGLWIGYFTAIVPLTVQ